MIRLKDKTHAEPGRLNPGEQKKKGDKKMKVVATVCMYGDFKSGDIRMKVFPTGSGTDKFQFQNIMHEAGYDAVLFSIHDKDLAPIEE